MIRKVGERRLEKEGWREKVGERTLEKEGWRKKDVESIIDLVLVSYSGVP